MKSALVALVLAALSVPGLAAAPKTLKVLKTGRYQAKVSSLACSACADEVEKTLKAFKGVDGVSVDDKAASVLFSVKKGSSVSVAKLQKALKDASDKMGMDADYRLKDISPAKG